MKAKYSISVIAFLILFPLVCFAQNEGDNIMTKGFENGDIITSSNCQSRGGIYAKSSKAYDEYIMGIFYDENSNVDNKRFFIIPLKKEGVYRVKFNSENGKIRKGDPLTSSSDEGIAMKATESGVIIGFALEDSDGVSGKIPIRVMIQYLKQ